MPRLVQPGRKAGVGQLLHLAAAEAAESASSGPLVARVGTEVWSETLPAGHSHLAWDGSRCPAAQRPCRLGGAGAIGARCAWGREGLRPAGPLGHPGTLLLLTPVVVDPGFSVQGALPGPKPHPITFQGPRLPAGGGVTLTCVLETAWETWPVLVCMKRPGTLPRLSFPSLLSPHLTTFTNQPQSV